MPLSMHSKAQAAHEAAEAANAHDFICRLEHGNRANEARPLHLALDNQMFHEASKQVRVHTDMCLYELRASVDFLLQSPCLPVVPGHMGRDSAADEKIRTVPELLI